MYIVVHMHMIWSAAYSLTPTSQPIGLEFFCKRRLPHETKEHINIFGHVIDDLWLSIRGTQGVTKPIITTTQSFISAIY